LIERFINESDTGHEIFVIAISYAFVFCGAWNDGLVGFVPSMWSHAFELFFAAALALEIIARTRFTHGKTPLFWLLLALDAVSVLTVIPALAGLTFLRIGRVLYAGIRLMRLLDRVAYRRKNPLYLVALYPVVVPLIAAVVFALERRTPGSHIHNYFQALGVCFAFALSLGNVRPANALAMALCGGIFIVGLVCIGVATNALSARYERNEGS
jgi:hypothetical protein